MCCVGSPRRRIPTHFFSRGPLASCSSPSGRSMCNDSVHSLHTPCALVPPPQPPTLSALPIWPTNLTRPNPIPEALTLQQIIRRIRRRRVVARGVLAEYPTTSCVCALAISLS